MPGLTFTDKDGVVIGGSGNGVGRAILPKGGDGEGLEFALEPFGIIQGRLPRIPRRIALYTAYHSAAAAEQFEDMADISAAAIALVWSGLDVGHWRRDFNRDLIEYGEAVRHALIGRGVDQKQMFDVGDALINQIMRSIPSAQEVDDEREDFTDRPLGPSEGGDTSKPTAELEPSE